MKRRTYILIIITYTVFNIGILVGYDIKREKYYEEIIMNEVKQNEEATNKIEDHIAKEENIEVKEEIKGESEYNKKQGTMDNYINEEEKNNSDCSIDYSSNNQVSYLENNKVFKVDAYEIEDNMSIVEKLKVMNLLKDLNYEDFEEIEGYMNYKNEKLAVMNTIKLLEKKLDNNEIESIKKIFSKYIDLDKVEGKN